MSKLDVDAIIQAENAEADGLPIPTTPTVPRHKKIVTLTHGGKPIFFTTAGEQLQTTNENPQDTDSSEDADSESA